MIVNVGSGIDDRLDRDLALVAEVRREDFDRGRRRPLPQRLDHFDELRCPAIGQIVTVHRSHDDMLEPQLGGSGRDMLRLQRIHCARHAGLHIAEGAGAGAGVAKDHHRRVLLGPAFTDVGTRRFLADGGEIEFAHQPPRLMIAFADGRLDPDPVGLALLRDRDGSVHWLPDSDWRLALPPPGRVGSGPSCPTSND